MPTTTSFTSGGKPIEAELFNPPGTPNGGTVIIAYGSDGMTDHLNGPWATMIKGYANDLAEKGFVTLIPDYLSRTGTEPERVDLQQIVLHRDEWQAVIADAVKHARSLPGVDASRIGLLGFSLGGHLCLRLRGMAKLLVEFFAPELDGVGSSGGRTLHAQIHHGVADGLVLFDLNAKSIERTLRADGASVTLFDYPDAGHGFVGDDLANKNARTQSKARAVDFFETHL